MPGANRTTSVCAVCTTHPLSSARSLCHQNGREHPLVADTKKAGYLSRYRGVVMCVCSAAAAARVLCVCGRMVWTELSHTRITSMVVASRHRRHRRGFVCPILLARTHTMRRRRLISFHRSSMCGAEILREGRHFFCPPLEPYPYRKLTSLTGI
jgi:hypothetical protein